MDNICFVIMPYGKKPDVDGRIIDFNDVYDKLVKEALVGYQGLEVLRCDDIEKPGWIHEYMINFILNARVAIVDTSTLNANVFYELGVRHSLKKNVTVLIHREGTTIPFNIKGMSSLKYGTTPKKLEIARKELRTWVLNSLKSDSIDSLVHLTVPGIKVFGPSPPPISKLRKYQYRLSEDPERSIAIVTGDYADIRFAEVWVNSENTTMQMDRYFGKSTSATIRYLGREVDAKGRVVDTIQNKLNEAMNGRESVDPLEVLVTPSGALLKKGVKWIFHVASVEGIPLVGIKPVERVHRCVASALEIADDERFSDDPVESIMMPIFGTGPAGGDLKTHARRHLEEALEYFVRKPDSSVRTVYFYAYNDVILETLKELASQLKLEISENSDR